jgi:SAM-dependent methyltransferase
MTEGHWDRFGAWIYDPFLWLGERRGMARRRHDLLAQAQGRVLEIGAGTGLNLRHYGNSVEALVLTEPVEPMARALERRVKRLARPADVRRASAEALPFAYDSFDMVVSTLVLCTVRDVALALGEIARAAARPPAAVHRAPPVGDRALGALAGSARAPVGRLRFRLPLQPAHARTAGEQPADDGAAGVRELARHAAAGSASDDRVGRRVSAAQGDPAVSTRVRWASGRVA